MSRKNSSENWNFYWKPGTFKLEKAIYDVVARFYRQRIIGPYFKRKMNKIFNSNEELKLLHAGSGAGEVDQFLPLRFKILALDFSREAVEQYRLLHPDREALEGDIFRLNEEEKYNGYFDGIYNLGVMEHFSEEEINKAIGNFSVLLKPGGKIVLFWPPKFGLSAIFLRILEFSLRLLRRNSYEPLVPSEPSQLGFLNLELKKMLRLHGFNRIRMIFTPADLFTFITVVAQKSK